MSTTASLCQKLSIDPKDLLDFYAKIHATQVKIDSMTVQERRMKQAGVRAVISQSAKSLDNAPAPN